MLDSLSKNIFKKVTRISEIAEYDIHVRAIYRFIKKHDQFQLFALRKGYRYGLKSIFMVTKGGKHVYTDGTKFAGIYNFIGARFCDYKPVANAIFQCSGLPAPKMKVFETMEDIKNYYRNKKIDKGVVAKQISGSLGNDVFIGITTKKKLYKLCQKLLKKRGILQIETQIMANKDYRIQTIDGKFYAAVERIPANVIGNGKNTVAQLIKQKNKDKLKPIEVDSESKILLRKQKLSLNSKVEKDRQVWLKKVANFSQGGDLIDASFMVHKSIKKQCEKVCQLLRMGNLGFDVLANDISKPLKEPDGAFIEVNARPHWILIHEVKGDEIVGDLLHSIFKNIKSK